jgi:hypothetical protein
MLSTLLGKGKKKKIFISFSIEDQKFRDFLAGQSKLEDSPFEFHDLSVKKAWEEEEWQQKCQERLKSCDAVIVLLSNNTWHSAGVRWEVKCALALKMKVLAIHVYNNDRYAIPPEFKGVIVSAWTWDNIDKFLKEI